MPSEPGIITLGDAESEMEKSAIFMNSRGVLERGCALLGWEKETVHEFEEGKNQGAMQTHTKP